MILNNTKFNLLDYADKTGVSQSLILKFIEDGGAEFLNEVFTDRVLEEMIKKDFLDGMTATGGLAHGRDVMASVFNDFKEQFDEKNPQ